MQHFFTVQLFTTWHQPGLQNLSNLKKAEKMMMERERKKGAVGKTEYSIGT
jgi:hypothetical protein